MATKRSSKPAAKLPVAPFPRRAGNDGDPSAGYAITPPAPTFTSDAARKLYAELAPPKAEPWRVQRARQALTATTGEARERVAGELYRMAGDENELAALMSVKAEVDATNPAEVDDPVTRQVTEALKPAETPPPAGPYLDDQQQLRDPAGRLVDVMGESWWSESWYGEARDLLRSVGYEHAESEDG